MSRSSLTRLLLSVLGMAFFVLVAGVHYLSTRGGESISALRALWLFVPAPLVFLAPRLRPLPHAARVLSRVYLALAAGAAMAVLGAVGWIGAERGIHPGPCDAAQEEALADYPDMAAVAEKVHFPSADGTPLAGWFVPGQGPETVLLLHGYGECHQETLSRADFLHAAGYSLLLFDFRHGGESGGEAVTAGYFERDDARGAIAYLATRQEVDAQRLGLLGLSMGAAVAIMVAAGSPEVAAVVAESPFKSADAAIGQSFEHFVDLPAFPFGPVAVWIIERRLGIAAGDVVPERDVARISPRALLLIHGAADTTILPENSQALYAAAGEPKELWLIPEAGHTDGMKVAAEEYRRRVTAFFDRHLRR